MNCPQCGKPMTQEEGRLLESGKPERLWDCSTCGIWCDWSLKKKNRINRTVACYWCGNNKGYTLRYDPFVPDFTCLNCGGRFPVPKKIDVSSFEHR